MTEIRQMNLDETAQLVKTVFLQFGISEEYLSKAIYLFNPKNRKVWRFQGDKTFIFSEIIVAGLYIGRTTQKGFFRPNLSGCQLFGSSATKNVILLDESSDLSVWLNGGVLPTKKGSILQPGFYMLQLKISKLWLGAVGFNGSKITSFVPKLIKNRLSSKRGIFY